MVKKLRYISLFSGIGGFDKGFEDSGMICDSVVEIDPYAQNILRRHFPNARLYDDVREIGKKTHGRKSIDLVCGGFPCQDVSIAGKRAGLAGERSGLWWEFARVIEDIKPQWVVIENVPGLLSSCGCSTCGAVRRILKIHTYLRGKRKIHKSCAICHAGGRMLASHKGRDYAKILHWLVQRGYGVAGRVLDSQFFGVPQRRRRVFIVGSLGDGRAAEILFERESLSGNTPPRREAGKETTGISGTLSANGGGLDRPAGNANELDFLVANTLTHHHYRDNADNTYVAYNVMPTNSTKNFEAKETEISQSLTTNGNHSGDQGGTYVAFQQNTRDEVRLIGGDGQIVGALSSQAGMKQQNYVARSLTSRNERNDFETENFIINLVNSGANQNNVKQSDVMDTLDTWAQFAGQRTAGVRRLTPIECERLQGFPDGWTEWGLSESGEVIQQADTTRYKQLGNAVTQTVARWLGRRIVESS